MTGGLCFGELKIGNRSARRASYHRSDPFFFIATFGACRIKAGRGATEWPWSA